MMDENLTEGLHRHEAEAEVCGEYCVHEHIRREDLPSDERMAQMGSLFKTFGDPTRLKILSALARQELCVCDIADLLGMTQSAISHQLAALKGAHLVKNRRDGKIVYYSLADTHVFTILGQGLEHVSE